MTFSHSPATKALICVVTFCTVWAGFFSPTVTPTLPAPLRTLYCPTASMCLYATSMLYFFRRIEQMNGTRNFVRNIIGMYLVALSLYVALEMSFPVVADNRASGRTTAETRARAAHAWYPCGPHVLLTMICLTYVLDHAAVTLYTPSTGVGIKYKVAKVLLTNKTLAAFMYVQFMIVCPPSPMMWALLVDAASFVLWRQASYVILDGPRAKMNVAARAWGSLCDAASDRVLPWWEPSSCAKYEIQNTRN
eukprot:PhM_4_TR14030/c0_g1_i1/m.67823